MADLIHDLYQNQVYPAMSHPLSDPAVSAVAAMIYGLDVPHPRRARVLEIGCCSGHNLIPLALRWPESEFTGIDLAERSIDEARERAAGAGAGNVVFEAADLTTYEPQGGPFDYIIAHGFFSWVPDEVKFALFDFCRKHLSPSGIATISFNLQCGWKPRLLVVRKVRAIQEAGGGDVMSSLALLKSVTPEGDPEHAIIDDMLAKGPAILAFDDFGPVNDPWPFDGFFHAASKAGLRWLGETDPAENLPSSLDEWTVEYLAELHRDELALQTAADEAAGRTFRSGVLCRNDAPVAQSVPTSVIWKFSVRAGQPLEDRYSQAVWQAADSFSPACVPVENLLERLPKHDREGLAGLVHLGIQACWLLPRIEQVHFNPEPPAFPKLDRFRSLCARNGLPLVDAWHKPCAFPERHYQVLAAMDGSRSYDELAAFSKAHCPELAFEPWIRHLAGRGMFS